MAAGRAAELLLSGPPPARRCRPLCSTAPTAPAAAAPPPPAGNGPAPGGRRRAQLRAPPWPWPLLRSSWVSFSAAPVPQWVCGQCGSSDVTLLLKCTLRPSTGQHVVPSDRAFLKALRFELGLTDDRIFTKHRDTCTQINHSSVYSVCTKGGDLWPVLPFQKSGPIYACLPVVEKILKPQLPFLSVGWLLQGLAVLLCIVGYISSSWKNEAECENRPASKFAYTDLSAWHPLKHKHT